MEYKITNGTIGVRPNVTLPNPEILKLLGDEGMRQITKEHYEILRVSEIKDMFPPTDKGIEMAVKHASDFFIQICGGERHFDQNRGRPMMAARHSPFKIDAKARIIWLEAYITILEKLDIPDDLKESFWKYLDIFSIWMLNTPDDK
ncbi:MAG: globin [Campylobacterales bacterium]|nr:globin [Campylobacterales bacterium]